ncbi:hypothetical protein X760_12995 [Mesorhizobium sp. LSHC422A00]|nr:hypothetical protein X760_12995 [Mesorhizobium sp. LSHC422A00]
MVEPANSLEQVSDLILPGDIGRDGAQTGRVLQRLAGTLEPGFTAADDDDFGA